MTELEISIWAIQQTDPSLKADERVKESQKILDWVIRPKISPLSAAEKSTESPWK